MQRSNDIHALSLVNHQLRRLTLPYLFSVLKRKNFNGLVELYEAIQEGKVGFHCLVQTLVIGDPYVNAEQANAAATVLLPLLGSLRLLVMELISLSPVLLSVVNAHPTLELVKMPPAAIQQLAPGLGENTMRKVQLTFLDDSVGPVFFVAPPVLLQYINQGLRVLRAFPRSLNDLPPFSLLGLKRLELRVSSSDDTLQLRHIVGRQPELEELTLFIRDRTSDWASHISSIVDLSSIFSKASIPSVEFARDYRRANPESTFSGWFPRAISLHCNDTIPISDVLAAVGTSLPGIPRLVLHWLYGRQFSSEQLADHLALLSALESLEIAYVGRMLNAEIQQQYLTRLPDADLGIKFAMLSLVQRLAKKLPRLHSVILNANDVTSADEPDNSLLYKYAVKDRLLIDGGGIEIAESAD